ncbi:GYF domain-containing protein [Forsythia ovata]|uniref:GYF domain-containing protein n=1 Tax=Forsythia ovata TaxID=205694 RepID=A0ABD1U7T9_9LAMI
MAFVDRIGIYITYRSDFPQLGKQSSWGSKSTPVKATPGGSMSRQKALLSSSPATAQSSVKGKNDSLTKHSEAMDFKEWCENECVRLIRSKDTSFLEFCLKQSREEAEMFLIQNLGPVDPEHKFIDKFLNYKDFLPVDVIDIAFPSRNDRKVTGFGVRDTTSDYDDVGGSYPGSAAANDGATKGGKKKGKKGKKVSPSCAGI